MPHLSHYKTSPREGGTPFGATLAYGAGLALLLAAPLIRGGNRGVALIPLEGLGLMVLLGAVLAWAQGRRQHWGSGARLVALLVLLASPLWIALVQLVPLPPDLWTALPGRAFYRELLEGLGLWSDRWRALSLTPEATLVSALAGIPVVAAVALGLTATRAQLTVLARVCLASALAQAILALAQLGPAKFLHFGAFFTGAIGTFANSNHLASYLVMCIPWTVLEMQRQSHERGRSRREGGQAWMWGVVLAVMMAAVVATGSRAGLAIALLVLAAAILIMPPGIGQYWPLRWRLGALGVLVLAALLAVGTQFLHRLGGLSADASVRWSIFQSTGQAAKIFWPMGSGLGSFSAVFPRFQPMQTSRNFVEHAHSDYVQFLMETGALGVICVLLAGWLLARQAWPLLRRVSDSKRPLAADDAWALAAALGLAGLLLHAWVDFNLRIPALAIQGAFCSGILLRQASRFRQVTDAISGPKTSTFH
ncbi:O-antigen ligase family protein [Hydrogenophaga sp. RWCD_12]|uniref:O-antigen ligase family protein n=1 Tax=Hydrogenophaga sp. RWCD_12 TaxID=3391190 RepID=UPI003984CE10